LLIENDRGEIEFKHLSFQEYFTAYQYYNHDKNGRNAFIKNFNDIWWQNVAIFYAGMTKDSPELMDEILSASKPTNFHEYLINLSGIGYLMQALYNTSIASRIEGIKRNISNANNAANYLITTKEPEFDIIKAFFHTNYGVYKIISYWYEFHHTSITLKEPLEKSFSELIDLLSDNNLSQDERFLIEYSAYMLASTLAEVDDYDFNFLKELLTNTKKDSNYTIALIDANFLQHTKNLPKDESKKRKEIKKFRQRLDLIDRDKVMESVNIRLNDGSVVRPKPKR
jgi:hypothetical protein